MAWTAKELLLFAQRCVYFTLRLESGLSKRKSRIIFVLVNYDEDGTFGSSEFPTEPLRYAFEYAQQRANELDDDVRIVMEACLKDEFSGQHGNVDEGLFAVATVSPSPTEKDVYCSSVMPLVHCSYCRKPATQQCVRRDDRGVSVIERGCDEHIGTIGEYWRN